MGWNLEFEDELERVVEDVPRDIAGLCLYGGCITIEQERDPRNANGVLADLAASRDFLRRAGF